MSTQLPPKAHTERRLLGEFALELSDNSSKLSLRLRLEAQASTQALSVCGIAGSELFQDQFRLM